MRFENSITLARNNIFSFRKNFLAAAIGVGGFDTNWDGGVVPGGTGWAIPTQCKCTKWSKYALNGHYFLKFTQFQEKLEFFLVDLPKHHQNWMELVIQGPNLIECDKIWVKTT